MIISENSIPPIEEFRSLMTRTDEYLNNIAQTTEDYFIGRNGKPLETDVYSALKECAKNTPFDGSISLVSGASFPDIVANKFYGVEVKSTKENHWTSIGSSILESTRVPDVERIFLTFGKLGKPVQFLSRPYEECLSGIAVTHYPRYQIDMRLTEGETIFDKMGISYDELRKMENPVSPVSKYYKGKLKEGETLWWAADESQAISSPPILRLWTSLTAEEKNSYTVKGYALFPEILNCKSTTKYQRYALWLARNCSIINTNIRDQFSAGGKIDITTCNGSYNRLPAAFGRIVKNKELIIETILNADENTLLDYWQVEKICNSRIEQWCELVSAYARCDGFNYDTVNKMLSEIFDV